MKTGIYCIRNLVNDKIYIGSSVNIESRWKTHKKLLKSNSHHSNILQNSFNKYGKDNFSFEIVSYVENKDNLIKYEQYWLDFFKPEYNICKVAGSSLGVIRSEEYREKQRQSMLKRGPYKRTLESRRKLSKSLTGKKHSAETKEKLRLANLGKRGRILSEESKERIRQSNIKTAKEKKLYTEAEWNQIKIQRKLNKIKLKRNGIYKNGNTNI